MPKTHWLDAVCVGASTPEHVRWQDVLPLQITALGRHDRQMVNVNRWGFPRGKPKATSVVGSFRSGDLVRAVVPQPLITAGIHVGTISVRATGSCDITTKRRRVGGSRFATVTRCSGRMGTATHMDVGRFLPRLNPGAPAPRPVTSHRSVTRVHLPLAMYRKRERFVTTA
jgi:hypothetical protein